MQEKKRFSIFKFTLFALALLFSGIFIYKNWDTFRSLSWRFSAEYMLLSFVFSLLLTLINALSLSLVLKREKINISLGNIYRFFANSNIYRHIPGGMWNHTGLGVLIAEKAGTSIKTAIKLVMVNLGFQVYAAFFFAVFFLPWYLGLFFLILLIALLLSVNYVFLVINKIWRKLFKKQKMILPTFSKKELFKLLGLNVIFWAACGVSFAFFVEGLGLRFNTLEFIKVSAAYVLAWTAGFLFIPAPSGMGVREFVLGYLLTGMNVSLVIGVSTSLLYRLLLLFRDFFLLLLLLFWRKK